MPPVRSKPAPALYSRAHDRYVIAELNMELGNHAEARRWFGSLLEGYDFMYAAAAQRRLAQAGTGPGATAPR